VTSERDFDSDFSEIDVSYSGSEAVITLTGELDLSNAPTLHECLLEASSGGADTIEVDIARLTFIDSTGLGVLVAAQKRLKSNGGSLVISGPTARVMRVLAVSGLTSYFTIRT
jgi:anti-sigma B factor antagonist